ncbi:MAG TPA: thiamine pyrophosphate-dependent dehydrogenase E1 component subunit alpha, partial [Saprospiraceae bacterium]|nr:thiamine pyrophosphate-dependent dehydrogenase E1 component subunit alpha [Saprospiraceae bacterium]
MLDFKTFTNISTNKKNHQILEDLWVAIVSRETSIAGRKEVLSGKAKFGILGDGKEIAQIAMSKAFKNGDFRAGYYRDQTFMFHKGLASLNDFFAQLYADAKRDPFSKGRQMNNHFATALIDDDGLWKNHTEQYNITSDISSTGGQMGRAVGLALASKKYREVKDIKNSANFSNNGNEVCFCTIGDASTSEGAFWEAINASAVMEIPLAVIVWDDGYGISVPKELQTVKRNISKALSGFQKDDNSNGIVIYETKAGDYPHLIKTFEEAIEKSRKEYIPVLIHVDEVTQPLGHSTSGSHERYKSKERLEWEKKMDPIELFINWILKNKYTDSETIDQIRVKAKEYVNLKKKESWSDFTKDIKNEISELLNIYKLILKDFNGDKGVLDLQKELTQMINPTFSDVVQNARKLKFHLVSRKSNSISLLDKFINKNFQMAEEKYHTDL